ncbi:MAG TPA: hypothetical protein ENL13_01955 [Thermoplasmatales archaeon]|nr:hypothetical protein [Thermoplasmatales archaeon]
MKATHTILVSWLIRLTERYRCHQRTIFLSQQVSM